MLKLLWGRVSMGGYLPHINSLNGCLMHWLSGVVHGHTVYQLHMTDAIVALARSVLAVERLRSFSGIPLAVEIPRSYLEPATLPVCQEWALNRPLEKKPLCVSFPHYSLPWKGYPVPIGHVVVTPTTKIKYLYWKHLGSYCTVMWCDENVIICL
jgi:hypothetical protein